MVALSILIKNLFFRYFKSLSCGFFRLILSVILLLIFWHPINGQHKNIDSIRYLLENHTLPDTVRVNLLIENAILWEEISIDSAFLIATEGERLAIKSDFIDGEVKSKILISSYYQQKEIFKQAENLLKVALEISETHEYTEGVIQSNRSLGNMAYDRFQYEKALAHYRLVVNILSQQAERKSLIDVLGIIAEINQKLDRSEEARESFQKILELSEESGYQLGAIKALNSLGMVNSATNRYPAAIDNFNKALMIAREAEMSKIVPVLIHNIGVLHLRLENTQKSKEYLEEAFSLYQENRDYRNIVNCLNDFGSLYKAEDDFRTALKYYNKALAIAAERGSENLIATVNNNIGHLKIELGDYQESISYLNKGLSLAEKTNSRGRICYSYLGLGKVFFKIKNYQAALSNALKGLEMIEEIDHVNHRNEFYELLAEIYAETGNYRRAYENHVLFKAFTDSAFNTETTDKIARLEFEYQLREEKLQARLTEEKLLAENERANEKLILMKNRNLWLVIGLLLLLLILGYLMMRHNVKNLSLKTKNALTEQKLLRSQMTPHFMFNSLSALQGIILNKEYDKSLLYLSKFSGLLRLTLQNSRNTLVRLENEIKAVERYLIVQNIARKVPFRYNIVVEDQINQDQLFIPPMLVQPFVENAVKHGFRELKEEQEIRVIFEKSKNILVCKIIDNGEGINSRPKNPSDTRANSTDLIKERLEILSRKYQLNLGVDFASKENEEDSGTIVIIKLPFKTGRDDEDSNSRG